ncbi:ABC transporter permease [Mucilaginibacter sp.]|uniref:ABC transporter permease n=1 Tax=Mucilaginibacter sp. TaxID=1882438 RepID=UPI0025F4B383|nr:ABC transporter permease [Mucilaginibacter sp.]
MIRNYLKVAWRNLVRNKAHTFINMAGLSVGLVCSLLILLWVQNELDVDTFHKNNKRLFSIYERFYSEHKAIASYGTSGILDTLLKTNIPEIEYASAIGFNGQHIFKVGDKILKQAGNSANEDFFKMFSYKLLQGNPKTALTAPLGIAISRKMAEDFFGSAQNAMGKTIRYDDKKDLSVTAVFENIPANSSRKFEYLTNWEWFLQENEWARQITTIGPGVFIQLRENANPALVEKKILHLMDKYNGDQQKGAHSNELGMQPYSEFYLHGNFVDGQLEGGRIGYVNLFSIVAVFILLIACINFMNLTTARSVKRAREIGVRKVVGAVRGVLIKQFIGESVLLTSVAVLFALFLLALLLPYFNIVTQKKIDLPFSQPLFWVKLVSITLITGIVSGSYPAIFLSSFNPVKVLKGTMKIESGSTVFRKGLVVFQFVLSVILIIGTLIISRQVNYIQCINLGYDKENLVYMPLEGTLPAKFEVFKDEALRMPGIQSVTRITTTPTNIETSDGDTDWDGKDPNLNLQFTQAAVGYNFTQTMKLKLLSGRDYSKVFPSDTTGFLINEAAAKKIGYADPVGRRLTFRQRPGRIIGVLKDFHYNSLHEEIRPMILRFGEHQSFGSALIRTQPGKTKQAIASLQNLYRQLNPNFQFSYTFSDEEYKKLYNDEQVVSDLSNAFAVLAILISCLGLLGLAMFTAERRIKEIGIRKVLGASVGSLFALLSTEFLSLVVIAMLIAIPVAWYATDKWLQTFAYHTPVQWWMFALSGGLIILVAVATVSFHAIKAALVNPIKSLRSE